MLTVSSRFDRKGTMSQTTTVHCNRCSDVILWGHWILEAKHGELSTRLDEPIDLCAWCFECDPCSAGCMASIATPSNWRPPRMRAVPETNPSLVRHYCPRVSN